MMKKAEVFKFVWFLVLLFFGSVAAILNSDPYLDLTDRREFGCHWYSGGLLNCTCEPYAKEFYIKQNSINSYDLVHMHINECNSIRFGNDSIKDMRNLRNIQLSNIKSITFEDNSLHWEGYVPKNRDNWEPLAPTLKVHIRGSTVEKISSYTFKGRIGQIKFEETIIKYVSAFAFSTLLHTDLIEFHGITFEKIEPQILKKFKVNQLSISNSDMGAIPSRTFSEIEVMENFIIKNSSFKDIKPSAFIVSKAKHFVVADCKIDSLDGEGFKVRTNGDVFFKNIEIKRLDAGAFMGISCALPSDHFFTITSAKFGDIEAKALLINKTSFIPKFSDIILETKCQCDSVEAFLNLPYLDSLSCSEGLVPILMKDYKSDYCTTQMAFGVTLIIICVCAVVVIIIIGVLTYYFKKVYKSGSYGDKKKPPENKLILPDGQTYRETEIMYIVERADLLTTDL